VTFEVENFESHIKESFSKDELHSLATSKIFISGGTGFAGRRIISTLVKLFESQDLPPIVIVSRSPEKAKTVFENYRNIEITDWTNLDQISVLGSNIERIIGFHASVPAASGAKIKFEEIETYRRQSEFFANFLGKNSQNPLFVNLSSGAVYERPTSGKILENQAVKLASAMNPYDLVKINDERIVFEMTQANIIVGSNPRLFSFCGPGIDIPGNFALGSFVNDALQGRAVQVTGSGSSERSYMSPIDMGIWILKSSIYPSVDTTHIGSSLGLKMSEIALLVAQIFGNGQVNVSYEQDLISESYVPETKFTENLFQIPKVINLEKSLQFWRQQLVKFY
jgi:nucleoside-diphosphate-sugar epimerase